MFGYIDRKGNSTFDFQNGDANAAANEKKQKEEEEERKRQEEDNKPQNKFYTIASQDYCWACPGVPEGAEWNDSWPNRKVYLFFYPHDKNGGDVSVGEWYEPEGFFTARSVKVKYRFVNENTITFQYDSRWRVMGERDSHEVSYTLTVINDGDKIKLLRYDGQEYVQQKRTLNDSN